MSTRAQPSTGAPARDQGALEFRLLGPLELRRQGEPLSLGGARQRALLALLCLQRGAVISVDEIVDELWGESPPATARHMVEVYVSKLRKLLGAGFLLTRAPGYRLDLDPACLDVARFERLLAEGREALARSEPDLAAPRLDEALALWRGQALADFAYEPFAQAEIARLGDLRYLAEEERIEAELALGRAEELVSEIEALVAAQPLRERRHGQLMLALYRAGRQADALAAYRRARQRLVEELGVEPGSRLRELERAILAHEVPLNAAPLQLRPKSPLQTRRIVTVLFAELADESDDVEPEMFQPRLAAATRVLGLHGATSDRLPDGTLMGLFGDRAVHEDDALRALRAADELRSLGVISRAAADSGEVLALGEGEVRGPVLRTASELLAHASDTEVLVGDATRRLTDHAVDFGPRVESGGSSAWSLLSVASNAPTRPLRFDAPMVGREAELRELRSSLTSSVRDRIPGLVTLLGEPGIGKSRLARAFIEEVSPEARVVSGRCLAYGDGITYWPLREVVDGLANGLTTEALMAVLAETQDQDAVARRLMAAVGLGDLAFPVEEISWATRRLFETVAQERPLIVLLEDIHWAEDTFLDLVHHVVEAGDGAPILLLCVARPDLLEQHPDWMQHPVRANRIWLQPLEPADADEFVLRLDSGMLSEERRRELVEAAEGNPLFLEQLIAFALDDVQDSEGVGLPPSLRALLATRLDRLGPGERSVLECAAVVGREFSVSALCELLPADAQRTLAAHFKSLTGKGILVGAASALPFETDLRFRHVLLREATYRSLPKVRRAELHERLARWLAQRAEPGAEELLGYHFEQAYWQLVQVARHDDAARNLGQRAAEALCASGQRAFDRGDYRAAVNLFGRCVGLLEEEESARLQPLLELGIALYEAVDFERAELVLSQAVESARLLGDSALEWRARLQRCHVRMLTEPDGGANEALQVAKQAIEVFEQIRDESGLSRAWRLIAQTYLVQWSVSDVEDAAERALRHARNAHDVSDESLSIDLVAVAMKHGATPVAEAIDRINAFLEWAREKENRSLEEGLLGELSQLHAQRGDFDTAHGIENERRAILNDLGQTGLVPYVDWDEAQIALLAGNASGAEALLRAAYDVIEHAGDRGHLSTLVLTLGEALYCQGRYDEIETLTAQSDEMGSPDDGANRICILRLRAKLLARRGESDVAKRLGEEAVTLSRTTGSPRFLGDSLMDMGDVLSQRKENLAEARSAFQAALDEYERKGCLASATRARRALKDT